VSSGVANQAPTIAVAAAASVSPVTANTTGLSVLGADDGGEPALAYTWSATVAPAPVSFSANGTNASKSSTATFTKTGGYSLRATVTDTGGLSVTSDLAVMVGQTLTAVVVSPASASVAASGSQQLVAVAGDQFGASLSAQPTFAWTVNGGGAISQGGLFSAGSVAGGPFTVTAGSAGKSGTAAVSVTLSSLTTLTPLADAYVRDGSFATTNYGAAADLQSKDDVTSGYSRRSFLKFDLTSVPAGITNARLRLFSGVAPAGQVAVQAFAVTDTSWTEAALTWNNQPAAAAALATTQISAVSGLWFEWDVTAYVQSQKSAGHNLISLVLLDPTQSILVCDFSSRESGANGPQLAVTAGP
jgi:hypothetical protein